jgi:hypothetical protein
MKGRCIMRYSKIVIVLFFLITVVILSGVSAFGQVTINPSGPLSYHVFLVADLGLEGGGKGNRDFQITVGAVPGGAQAITVEVRDDVTNQLLVSGQTNTLDQSQLVGTYFIGELDDRFGGDFEVQDQATDIYDKILATGALPRGRYRITVGLSPGPTASATLLVEIVPPYLQPLYPVDMQTNRAVLSFRWVSNIKNQELHIYLDSAGRKEVLRGSGLRLPRLNLGGSVGSPQAPVVEGSDIAPLLEDGNTYFWQVHGNLVTSHGNERTKSVLSAFQYFEEREKMEYIGLSDPDKQAIKDALIELLKEVMGRQGERAARSLDRYELNRVTVDDGPASREEIMSILGEIIAGEATATAINFR